MNMTTATFSNLRAASLCVGITITPWLFAQSASADIFRTSSAASAEEQAELRKTEIKQEIFRIASENTLNDASELPATRAILEPLINELVAQSPKLDLPAQMRGIVGAWKELWSDDREPEKPGSVLNRQQVYQIVTGVGVFYNFGVVQSPFGEITSLLRGQYTESAVANGIFITFNDISFVRGRIDPNVSLTQFVADLEDQLVPVEKYPFDLTVPRGPIGARGFLNTIYVDDDLRIASGFNFADGKNDLYVLKRVDTVTYKLD